VGLDGIIGARLTTTPGGEAVVELDRINVAERLYRITGAVRTHSTEASLDDPELRCSVAPVCRVWSTPLAQLVLAPEPRPLR